MHGTQGIFQKIELPPLIIFIYFYKENGTMKSDHNKPLITLTMIPLMGFHCRTAGVALPM